MRNGIKNEKKITGEKKCLFCALLPTGRFFHGQEEVENDRVRHSRYKDHADDVDGNSTSSTPHHSRIESAPNPEGFWDTRQLNNEENTQWYCPNPWQPSNGYKRWIGKCPSVLEHNLTEMRTLQRGAKAQTEELEAETEGEQDGGKHD